MPPFKPLVVAALPLTLACLAANAAAQAPATPPSGVNLPTPPVLARITQAIDEKNLVVLKGNVHPLARPQYDQGAVSDGLVLNRMLLLLQRGPDQETALERLLDAQQDKSSPYYHQWLTPQQFGQQFGPADADIQTVTTWLQSHGFQLDNVTAGRTVIEFSGTAGQVRSAFHTEIHNYLLNGEAHTANASDPQIPAALAPVVLGPVSLNNFPISSHIRQLGTFHRAKGSTLAQPLDKPLYTFPGCTPAGCLALGPADFATIYNSAPLLSGTPKIDGTGQTIAIVGESDIDPTDVTDFQTMFGMTPNFSAANNIIVNGAHPGKNGSEGESDLDVQWATAVAPGATIKFVTSEPTETTAGIFLSSVYIVDNNIAGVMSESFGGCEQLIGTLNQFHNSLWQQAAAQGTTVILSAGDGGSAGCDNFDSQQTATRGLAVSGFASTPYNVAVGGTDFDEINRWSQFWSSTNTSPSQSSALSYIPEIPWNDSCSQLGISGCGPSAPNGSLNIVAGSGGISTLYPKPSWQSGPGVPVDGHRDVPDVSLFASNGFDGTFYIICQKDVTGTASCNLNAPFFTFQGIGGTSASAPAFAGIMALVNQNQATAQNPAPRQGNANYVLYSLFKKQTSASPAINCNASATPSTSCTFYDVTRGNSALPTGVGTNSVPCTAGSPNCSTAVNGQANGVLIVPGNSSTEAYTVTTGYDLVTGLGSVNIANLVKNWSSVSSLASATTLSTTVNGQAVTSITGITHGTPVTVTSSVAAGQGASGTPSGQVALLATPSPIANAGASLGFDVLTLDSTGTATDTGVVLPGGQYNLTSHYQGDGTFGSSDSTPPISVNISAEPSKTIISIPVFDPTTGRETGNAPASLVYGSPYIARIDVGNAQAALSYPPQPLCTPPACPTGTITWTDSLNSAPAVPLDGGTFVLNSSGFTEDQPIQLSGGSHMLTASYSGDASYGTSSGTYAVTITPASMQLSFTVPASTVIGTPFVIYMSGATSVRGAAPMGTVTVYDGTTAIFTTSGTGIGGYAGTGSGSTPTAGFGIDTGVTLSTLGSHSLTLTYSADPDYSAASTAPQVVHVVFPTTLTLQASSTAVNYGTSATLTATLTTTQASPPVTGQITFASSTGQGTVAAGPTTQTLINGFVALQATATITPQSSDRYTANYAGDTNYSLASGTSPYITVNNPDFSVVPSQAGLTITAGQSANMTITITPAYALNGSLQLQVPSPVVQGITCSVSPAQIQLSGGNSVTATLTCTVPAPSSSASTSQIFPMGWPELGPRNMWWKISCVVAALALIFWFLPVRLRLRGFANACMLLGMISFFMGCGGGNAGNAGGGGGGSLAPTTTTITVPSTKVSGSNLAATVQVTGNSPTGSVSFGVVGESYSFNTEPLVNGAAQYSYYLGAPGAFLMTAQYSGDSRNLPSQVHTPLSVVQTGMAGSVTVDASIGSALKQTSVALTIQ